MVPATIKFKFFKFLFGVGESKHAKVEGQREEEKGSEAGSGLTAEGSNS